MGARAIVVVDHGSREPAANALVEAVVEQVRAKRPDCAVAHAHMEIAEPDLATALEACIAAGATEVVVAPFFLAPGRHGAGDIPRLAREAAARHPAVTVHVADPLGAHPAVVDALLDRIDAT